MCMDAYDNIELLLRAEHKTPVKAAIFKPVCMVPSCLDLSTLLDVLAYIWNDLSQQIFGIAFF